MTPLGIEILLHYYCRADDYRNGDHSEPAVRELLEYFVSDGLLDFNGFGVERFPNGAVKARYSVTPRARMYVEFLQDVPFPTQKWLMPKLTIPDSE